MDRSSVLLREVAGERKLCKTVLVCAVTENAEQCFNLAPVFLRKGGHLMGTKPPHGASAPGWEQDEAACTIWYSRQATFLLRRKLTKCSL